MTVEQKVVTVSNTDTDINIEIAMELIDNWTVMSLTLWNDDSKVIILFNRVVIPA